MVEKKIEKIEVKDKKIYVLVGKKITVYAMQDDAIKDLKDELKKDETATIAVLSYESSDNKKEQGTFNVAPISWKDIAMGLL